jgi:hypothetical protein
MSAYHRDIIGEINESTVPTASCPTVKLDGLNLPVSVCCVRIPIQPLFDWERAGTMTSESDIKYIRSLMVMHAR